MFLLTYVIIIVTLIMKIDGKVIQENIESHTQDHPGRERSSLHFPRWLIILNILGIAPVVLLLSPMLATFWKYRDRGDVGEGMLPILIYMIPFLIYLFIIAFANIFVSGAYIRKSYANGKPSYLGCALALISALYIIGAPLLFNLNVDYATLFVPAAITFLVGFFIGNH